ncbi:hypothetical protein ACFU6K_35315 [Kitasatospora sp. NPDC057512]|uniref:hypothetical protein n=1 Tax=Kitasatospora sp. NPDC057512 TaxID=3346154 RepID=UPI0036B07788
MYEQPPPQAQPIDRTYPYPAYLKVVKETVDIGESIAIGGTVGNGGDRNAATSSMTGALGFSSGPQPSDTVVDTSEEAAATAANPVTQIMDGPGGFYGPSFADPPPWACDGAPTPGCLPSPPPSIGGLY